MHSVPNQVFRMINAKAMETSNRTEVLSVILYNHAPYEPENMMTKRELRNLRFNEQNY